MVEQNVGVMMVMMQTLWRCNLWSVEKYKVMLELCVEETLEYVDTK